MYGLVGKKLKHSFSKEIHRMLGNEDYHLFEITSIEDFLKTHEFKGLNVTIPYKTDIIPYLDELDDIAKETYSANTIINDNGRLIGYNTDYDGLRSLLVFNRIKVKNKNILVLGNGSVSKTVVKLMNDLQAKSVVRLCRSIKSNTDHTFNEFPNYTHFDVIINTTPVGMYPNNDDELLIRLDQFTQLSAVIDLVYNPLRTRLLLEAERLNIKAVNGLYMLIMQAAKAHELFFHKEIPLNLINKLYKKTYQKHLNIVFIGLPLSGKSKFMRLFSEKMHKKGLDIDSMIEKSEKISIPEIFDKYGESRFRSLESKSVKEIYKLQNLIISTGGGLIENSENMEMLKQNGLVIFLNKDPEIIAKKKVYGRPLLKNSNDILTLAQRRLPLYIKYADIIIDINKDTETHYNEMKEKINEYIGRKWSKS